MLERLTFAASGGGFTRAAGGAGWSRAGGGCLRIPRLTPASPEVRVRPRSPGAPSSHLRRILENWFFFPLSDPFVREGPSSSTCRALSVFKGYIARFFYRELGQNWVGHLCVGERPLNSRHSSRLSRVFSRLFWSRFEGFLRNYRSISSPDRLRLFSSPGWVRFLRTLGAVRPPIWFLSAFFRRLWTTLCVSRWEDRGSRAWINRVAALLLALWGLAAVSVVHGPATSAAPGDMLNEV